MSGSAVAHEHVIPGAVGRGYKYGRKGGLFGSCLSEDCIYTVFCICDNRKSVDKYCII